MARKEARIHVSIWSDPDFTALAQADQRTYLMVLSQPGISLCGVLAWTPGRLARMAADSTPESVTASIARLADARFLVVDFDTDELLVRSFIRYDGVWRNRKTRTAMFAQRDQIMSPMIRSSLDGEIHRATIEDAASDGPPDEAPDDPSNGVSDRASDRPRSISGHEEESPSPSPSPTPSPSPSPPPAQNGTVSAHVSAIREQAGLR